MVEYPPLQYFSPRQAGEKNVLTFAFANGLSAGNTLAGTPTVSVSTYIGTDTNPTSILNGPAVLDSTATMVLVPVAVSLAQQQYLISVQCGTGNPGITLVLPAVLPVGPAA